MPEIEAEAVARHIVRHLVHDLRKAEGQSVTDASLRHWWRLSLGQLGKDFDRGIAFASANGWVRHEPKAEIMLTSKGSAAA